MHYQQVSDRDQVFMTSLDQMVSEDSFARIIDLFADAITPKADTVPIKELGFKHALLKREDD